MTTRAIGRILLGLLSAGGCGRGPASGSSAATVRDSASIEIVEHPAGFEQSLPQWTLPEMVTEIGSGESPGQDLDRVRGASRLSDGRIVVANGGSSELRFYDSMGTYLSAIGREGNGPGEFASLSVLQRMDGDTLGVFDNQLKRFSRFAPSGGLVRSVSFIHRTEQGYLGVLAGLIDGRFLGSHNTFGGMKETSGPIRRDPFAVGVIGADGSGFDTVAVVPGSEVFPAIGREAGQVFPTINSLGFGRTTVMATDGIRIFVGTNEPAGIRVYQPDGKLIRMMRSATAPEPVTEEHKQQRRRETLARFEQSRVAEQIKAEWKKNAEDDRYADAFPDYERLLVGRDGTVWQERTRRAEDEGRRYIVYDSAGKATATVRCPDRFRPYEVGPAEIIGLWRDSDGVHHVRVYRVSGAR